MLLYCYTCTQKTSRDQSARDWLLPVCSWVVRPPALCCCRPPRSANSAPLFSPRVVGVLLTGANRHGRTPARRTTPERSPPLRFARGCRSAHGTDEVPAVRRRLFGYPNSSRGDSRAVDQLVEVVAGFATRSSLRACRPEPSWNRRLSHSGDHQAIGRRSPPRVPSPPPGSAAAEVGSGRRDHDRRSARG